MATSDLLKQVTAAESAKPAEYKSEYGTMTSDLLNQIQNRTFKYDFNADPLYQNYKDYYTQQGKVNGMNAAAAAATNTGGFANSYGVTASAAANQSALKSLSNQIPTLYSAAVDRYSTDTSNLYNQYNALADAENTAYNQYRDTVGDWQANRSYAYQKYADSVQNDQSTAELAYQKARAKVTDEQWQKEFNESVRQFNKTYSST